MASSDPTRPFPPLPPPPRAPMASYTQIDAAAPEGREGRRANSDYPRTASGFAPAEPQSRTDAEAGTGEGFRPGSFAPETAIDEQIADLEYWAEANLNRDRKDKLRFWVLRGLAFLSGAGAATTAGLAAPKAAVVFGALAALCVAIDSAWPSDSFRNVHRRAVYDLRELQNTLKLRWDKVRLAHPDAGAPQRTAHALALLDQVQNKREEIGKYLGSAEASPGIKR